MQHSDSFIQEEPGGHFAHAHLISIPLTHLHHSIHSEMNHS